MKYNPMTRRFFLQGLGGFTLGLPILPSLLPKAHAQSMNNNIRFINVWHGNGTIPARFFPNNLNMTNFGGGQRGVLSSRNTPVSEILGAPFNGLKRKMTVIGGLNSQGHGHNPSITLCGHGRLDEFGYNDFNNNNFRPWPSIDQIMAASNKIYPQAPMLRSLHLKAVRQASPYIGDRPDSVSFSASGSRLIQVPHERDPRAKFNLLFGGASNPGGGVSQAVAAKNMKNKKVVDKVLEDYNRLVSSQRISAAEKMVLDEHMTHLNQIEERLRTLVDQPVQAVCSVPSAPSGPNVTHNQLSNFVSMHIDLIVAAIKCGHTKVATLMLNRVTDLESYPFLQNGRNQDFHGATHDTRDNAYLRDILKFFSGKVAELAQKLDVVEDASTGATYLDNSMIYFGNCMDVGLDHSTSNLPVVILGSGGGFLKTDQYLRYNNGVYNQLLVSLMMGMGLAPADFRFNNQAGYGEYGFGASPSNSALNELLA